MNYAIDTKNGDAKTSVKFGTNTTGVTMMSRNMLLCIKETVKKNPCLISKYNFKIYLQTNLH